MNKRIIIKTSLICFGIFLLICSVLTWFLMDRYEIDKEKRYSVVVAKVPINPGDVITDSMMGLKTIKESSYNEHMVIDLSSATGTKAISYIGKDDYIRDYVLLPREKWYKEDERTIVIPMEVEERLANLVKRGVYVDIKLIPKEGMTIPELVLSKVIVEDVLDENGVSLGNSGVNKKAYICLVLDNSQRDRIYVAKDIGKLIFELYCDTTQTPPKEEFQIPKVYIEKSVERSKGYISTDKIPQKVN